MESFWKNANEASQKIYLSQNVMTFSRKNNPVLEKEKTNILDGTTKEEQDKIRPPVLKVNYICRTS